MPIAAGLDVIEDQATFERERKKLLIECVKIPWQEDILVVHDEETKMIDRETWWSAKALRGRRVELGGRESDGRENVVEMRKTKASKQYIGGERAWLGWSTAIVQNRWIAERGGGGGESKQRIRRNALIIFHIPPRKCGTNSCARSKTSEEKSVWLPRGRRWMCCRWVAARVLGRK